MSNKDYIIFILGYDLLHKELTETYFGKYYNTYDVCKYIAEKFIESEFYTNKNTNLYGNLSAYIETNKQDITQYIKEQLDTIPTF